MFNRVILVGYLSRDPELRYTPNGMPVANLGLAVNSRFKQNGEVKEETLFIDIVSFGATAENCNQYLGKGDPVLVEGRLRERRWEYEGQQKRKIEVLANNIRFLPRKDKSTSEEDLLPPEEVSDLEPF